MTWVIYDTTAKRVRLERSEKWMCLSYRRDSDTPKQFQVLSKDEVPRVALTAWKRDLGEAEESRDLERLANHSVFEKESYVELLERELEECRGRVQSLQRRLKRERDKVPV